MLVLSLEYICLYGLALLIAPKIVASPKIRLQTLEGIWVSVLLLKLR